MVVVIYVWQYSMTGFWKHDLSMPVDPGHYCADYPTSPFPLPLPLPPVIGESGEGGGGDNHIGQDCGINVAKANFCIILHQINKKSEWT
jgi:hypothetical protein